MSLAMTKKIKNAPTSCEQHVIKLRNSIYALRAVMALLTVKAHFIYLFLQAVSLLYV